MAHLTIGGQTYDLAPTARELKHAELKILQQGGKKLLVTLTTQPGAGWFALFELEAMVWAAWRGRLADDRIEALLDQYFREGGNLFDLHQVCLDALLDSGLVGRRAASNGAGPPADPPEAGTSAA